jgi:hypothetical protein
MKSVMMGIMLMEMGARVPVRRIWDLFVNHLQRDQRLTDVRNVLRVVLLACLRTPQIAQVASSHSTN